MKLLNARKKVLTLAVASAMGGAVMMAAPAQAMNVSQNNVGEVLIYPYYTVKNGFDTIFSVVNTSNRTAAFKIRFREALNSREVLDFNVVLSPFDVWNGSVTASGNGGVVRTYDQTCTSPIMPNSATAPGARELPFTSLAYDGTDTRPEFGLDGAGTSITRAQEGYYEVILMAVSSQDVNQSSNVVEYNAKHVSGTPRDCTKVDAAFLSGATIAANFTGFSAPENILKGHSTFIDVATGKAVDATPTHIEDFSAATMLFTPGDLSPDLGDGDGSGTVYGLNNGATWNAGFIGSEHGVSGLLAADAVINEFAASGSGAQTDWIVTFPTKHHYVDRVLEGFNDPFYQQFDYILSTNPTVRRGKSCDNVAPVLYNREEGTVTPGGTVPSPAPQGSARVLCYEANVITFNNSNVFGTGVNHENMDTSAVGSSGWMMLGLNIAEDASSRNIGTGLPVIGFAAIMRNNASEAGNNRNYGSTEEHTYMATPPDVPAALLL